MKNFILSADRMMAAMFGFSGRVALSTELVFTTRLQWMRAMLDYIEPAHCENSVYSEGPYCRLSDKQLRNK